MADPESAEVRGDGGLVAAAQVLAERACRLAGLPSGNVTPIRVHSNAVFFAPDIGVVIRIGSGDDALGRARRAVGVTRWLADQDFPAVVPLLLDQPVAFVDASGTAAVATFWQLALADPKPVTAAELGRLLRTLHGLPCPPFDLPEFQPLRRLIAAVSASAWLPENDQAWILSRADQLRQALAGMAGSLGYRAMLHGDAQLSNTIRTSTGRVALADWDSVTWGPICWDLVSAAAERRFGGSAALLGELLDAYGGDPTTTAGWRVLLDVYELRSVAAHIRRAPSSAPHAAEARLRIASLRAGDDRVRWHPVG